MEKSNLTLRNEEQIIYSLRSLYEKYGFAQYKMTKFEEYDLYAGNKDYLTSDAVITFNDTNGKLMALKPDVTLSIIKNTRELNNEIRKLYYNENVYRVSRSSNTFKEIMQTGLECLGDVDDYCIAETLILAAKSLKSISDKCILSVCNLDILSYAVDEATGSAEMRKEILSLIGEKNLHGLRALCAENGIDDKNCEILSSLASLHGKTDYVISKLVELVPGCGYIAPFGNLLNSLPDEIKEIIDVDFSFIGDLKYYNGVIFKGFISGIPTGVVTGGQYDKLMNKMGKKSKAIGFAVYLDALERFGGSEEEYDVDTVLVYDKNSDISELNKTVENLTSRGVRVLAVRDVPKKLKYRQMIAFSGKEA